jgi:hypothetical protein
MRLVISIVMLFVAIAGGWVDATTPVSLDAAALQAWARRPWDKASLMNTRLELGRYRGVPVVAEFPCSDVCPQYTVRIIHFRLPPGTTCASVGGVEKELLVPIAITVRTQVFCIPAPLVDSGLYETR